MSIFQAGRHRNPPDPQTLPEPCDRCGAGGRVRVGKYLPVFHEQYDRIDVVSRELDLVLCGHDYDLHQPGLAAQGWRVIEAAK